MKGIFDNITEVFSFYDKPLSFIRKDNDINQFVFWYSKDGEYDKWLLMEVVEEDIYKLKKSKVCVSEFIRNSGNIRLIETKGEDITKANTIENNQLELKKLPSRDMYIYDGKLLNVKKISKTLPNQLIKKQIQEEEKYNKYSFKDIDETTFIGELSNSDSKKMVFKTFYNALDIKERFLDFPLLYNWFEYFFEDLIYFSRNNFSHELTTLNIVMKYDEKDISEIYNLESLNKSIQSRFNGSVTVRIHSIYTLIEAYLEKVI